MIVLTWVKFTNKETPTLKSFSSSILIGGNLGSLIPAVIAYSGRTLDSKPGANVPIHPLNSPFFFQVTKIGTSGFGIFSG